MPPRYSYNYWNAITEQYNDLHEVTAHTIDAIELIVEKHAPKRKLSRNQQLIKRKTKKSDYSPKNS